MRFAHSRLQACRRRTRRRETPLLVLPSIFSAARVRVIFQSASRNESWFAGELKTSGIRLHSSRGPLAKSFTVSTSSPLFCSATNNAFPSFTKRMEYSLSDVALIATGWLHFCDKVKSAASLSQCHEIPIRESGSRDLTREESIFHQGEIAAVPTPSRTAGEPPAVW